VSLADYKANRKGANEFAATVRDPSGWIAMLHRRAKFLIKIKQRIA
jgi:hypothetical protein